MNKRIDPKKVKEVVVPFDANNLYGKLGELPSKVESLIKQYGEDALISFHVRSTPDPYWSYDNHDVTYEISWTELED